VRTERAGNALCEWITWDGQDATRKVATAIGFGEDCYEWLRSGTTFAPAGSDVSRSAPRVNASEWSPIYRL
jgi:hypothetical protein